MHTGYIGTCEFTHPRANLGPPWTSHNPEERFAHSFAQAYNRKYVWVHSGAMKTLRLFAHEVPVNGFGIADLVTVSWKAGVFASSGSRHVSLDVLKNLQPTVRAFEVKLSNWRRGLMQAHRYRFFSDAAILVIPDSKLHLAEKYLSTFHNLNVGLWSYNEISEVISTVFTPRPRRPMQSHHREKAIERVLRATMQYPPSA